MVSDSCVKLSGKDMGKEGIPSDSISSVSGIRGGAIDQSSSVYYPHTSCYDYHYPPDLSPPIMISDSSTKQYMGKEGIPSASISSVSGIKGAIDQSSGAYYPRTSCYDYRYPGYNGTFPQFDDKGYINTAGGSYTGIEPANTSLLYYLPGCGPYTSSEYLQQPSCYTYDLAYTRNGLMGPTDRPSPMRSVTGPSGSGNSNVYNYNNSNLSSKISALPFSSKFHQPSSHLSRSIYQNPLAFSSKFHQPSSHLSRSIYQNPLDKLGSNFRHAGKLSPFADRNPGYSTEYNSTNYQSNDRIWNDNYRYRSKENIGRFGENKTATELTRGPRASDSKSNSSEQNQNAYATDRNKYNLKEFKTDYDHAKFFVIKSYSEDDVHKCIKYDVWSSTPNGNKKLHDAFCEAEAKTKETGVRCPIFLFFSVNGSGQFVGVAEMIGHVDFEKSMDFWQLDKWNGYFPIRWHLIKDIPNSLLRHIILENNDNRPVTFTRDTQEIGLKQGLEMLSIFKSYSEKTSVLDDFSFYEDREKALKAKRNDIQSASQTNGFKNGDHEKKHFEGLMSDQSAKADQSELLSLVSLTKNLSLNSRPVKSSV